MLGVGPGDEVICSDLTFAASANAIVYLGAKPVFIDSDAATWNIDAESLALELESRAKDGLLPKAAVIVDLYGQCADYDRILKICGRYDVPVIEDAAEALGATYGGKSAGTFGVMGVFSFNGNKIITTSGGGMLVSDDESYVKRAKFLATQARDPAPHYEHSQIGYNYRMSNLLAAVGRGQLARLDAKIARRKEINEYYRQSLRDLPGIEFMPIAEYGTPNYWLTVILITPAHIRRGPGGRSPSARGREHRIAPYLEADAHAAGVQGLPGKGRKGQRGPVRQGALPSFRNTADRRRSESYRFRY